MPRLLIELTRQRAFVERLVPPCSKRMCRLSQRFYQLIRTYFMLRLRSKWLSKRMPTKLLMQAGIGLAVGQ